MSNTGIPYPVNSIIVQQYNQHRALLGYPELSKEEIEQEFNRNYFALLDYENNYLHHSAQRYVLDENNRIVYDDDWEENLQIIADKQ